MLHRESRSVNEISTRESCLREVARIRPEAASEVEFRVQFLDESNPKTKRPFTHDLAP